MAKCTCGRVIPKGCPNCPPHWFRCPCGEMVLIEPDVDEAVKELLKQYKERSS